MTTKKLKPNPIIPASLYASRAADMQIRRIVEEMGRPGYVLVARQMGKTNLLLNAKKELESKDDCFLYMDVSNLFPDIASFFRNIIDTALDAYPEKFGTVAEIIQQRRLMPRLSHKEHELELRDLLRAIKGKMIICLDEIDALTKTAYSDQVFSFLRSIYFSGRINFPEFNRLTYILSGVAEPSSLIKNKDVSPFNIGEKILLEDFSSTEFNLFVEKSGLNIESEIRGRIYHWIRGNPRMTWDVCSKLEDMQIDGHELTPSVVDDCITRLYLMNFDVPPIDHLRTLAEDDKNLREALIALHYGKASAISDVVKARLYLHGFVQSASKEEPIRIKNLVIEEALSESWLQDIEKSKTSLFERAEKKRQDLLFDEALELYEEYVGSANCKDEDLQHLYYSMGRCFYETGRYSDSLEHFVKAACDRSKNPRVFLATQYYMGVCKRNLNLYAEAIECLNLVIQEGADLNILTYHYDAKISISSTYLAVGNYAEVVEIADSIVCEEEKVRVVAAHEGHANELLFAALYNQSLALEFMGEIEHAKECISKALEFSDSAKKIGALLRLAGLTSSKTEKQDFLAKCVQNILEDIRPIFSQQADEPLQLNPKNMLALLTQLVDVKDTENYEQLFGYVFTVHANHNVSVVETVISIVLASRTKSDQAVSLAMVERALTMDESGMTVNQRRDLLTFALILRPFNTIENIAKIYIDAYWDKEDGYLIASDYRLAFTLVREKLSKGEFAKARSIINRVSDLASSKQVGGDESGGVIIEFLDALYHLQTGPMEIALPAAKILRNRLSQSEKISPPLYFQEDIFNDLGAILSDLIVDADRKQHFRRSSKKIGRNDQVVVKFLDGEVERGKFKKFERRIAAGECELIENT